MFLVGMYICMIPESDKHSRAYSDGQYFDINTVKYEIRTLSFVIHVVL